jgi:hypothetical protein
MPLHGGGYVGAFPVELGEFCRYFRQDRLSLPSDNLINTYISHVSKVNVPLLQDLTWLFRRSRLLHDYL